MIRRLSMFLACCAMASLDLDRPVVWAAAPSSEAMTAIIDRLVADRWQEEGVDPAPRSSDAEFIRRIYLDLTGVIPRVAAVREFLADTDPDKRRVLIDRLLHSPRHATHMANTWRAIMLPGGTDLQQLANVAGVQNWLRRQFMENLRYDRFVSDFLVASGGGESGPALFYTSLDLAPEKLAASTARMFLGLQIECAECHDHPFDHWTQQDFWGYAAFFAQLDGADGLADLAEGDVTLPDSETVVLPKYPAGRVADREDGGSRRVRLAIWVGSRDNPYLARAAVNRSWSHLFGRGLVEPVDDLGEHNRPSHPQLMEQLTDFFVATGFDVRLLYRTLANTRAYQLSSGKAEVNDRPELLTSMAIKTMSAEQLYDSLAAVLLRPPPSNAGFPGAPSVDTQRLAFAAKMQMRGANATEFEAGVLQALTMLNGTRTAAITSVEQSGLLQSLQAPWMSDDDRIDVLFLATLARFPEPQERSRLIRHVTDSREREADMTPLSDVLWALINSAEFALNH